jgi:membrane protease YdiL (CAAX protease family)
MEATIPTEKLGLILKVAFFVFLAYITLIGSGLLLYVGGVLIAGAGSTFISGLISNAVATRVFERKPLTAVGMNWHAGSLHNLWIGAAAGSVAAVVVLGGPLLVGAARIEATPELPGSLASAALVSVILIFGAVGEELLFRGYGFQTLFPLLSRIGTLLFASFLFGFAHWSNQNASLLGIINTVGFGIVLGYAFIRSGDLWLPIGIHVGWNWMLPLAGVNLSGFTMGVTGYAVRWNVSELWSGGAYGPEASILTCGIIVALMIFLYKAPVHPQRPLLFAGREEEA